ncbi:hypothetical protein [Methylibium petroleiphilum]|uniref:hypothetical protein n=1 Tax=Methylibium petroleiphilum TaxID=105560 RepID=UPI00003CD5C3|nr:hypothetical protein [Methylibium petroleiphilum]
MTNPTSLCPQGATLLREAQKLLAEIDSWGGTVHESHLAGLRAAVRQAQGDSTGVPANTTAEAQ